MSWHPRATRSTPYGRGVLPQPMHSIAPQATMPSLLRSSVESFLRTPFSQAARLPLHHIGSADTAIAVPRLRVRSPCAAPQGSGGGSSCVYFLQLSGWRLRVPDRGEPWGELGIGWVG